MKYLNYIKRFCRNHCSNNNKKMIFIWSVVMWSIKILIIIFVFFWFFMGFLTNCKLQFDAWLLWCRITIFSCSSCFSIFEIYSFNENMKHRLQYYKINSKIEQKERKIWIEKCKAKDKSKQQHDLSLWVYRCDLQLNKLHVQTSKFPFILN